MIKVKNLNVMYKKNDIEVVALDNINLNIEYGKIYGVIGPSGCGKSTLIKALSGIIKEYTGEIFINNIGINPKINSIGLVPQNYGLLPWKTCYENILLASKIKKQDIDEEKNIYINKIISDLKIDTLVNRYPKELSGGQRQRVALARTFAQQPDIILLDEAFSALDVITSEECQKLFLQTWNENKFTTIIVSHSVDEIAYLTQKIIVLSHSPGKVLKEIDNPVFCEKGNGKKSDYYNFALKLRKLMKEEWGNEDT